MEAVRVKNSHGRIVDVTEQSIESNWPKWEKQGWEIIDARPEILTKLGIPPQVKFDQKAAWAVENNKKFGPKFARQSTITPPCDSPSEALEVPTREPGAKTSCHRPGVLIHVIAEAIRPVGLVYNVAECASWAAGYCDVHVIAPKKDSVEIDIWGKAKLHLVGDEREAEQLIRSLKPDLIRHHSPRAKWAIKKLDPSVPLIGTAHNWPENIDPPHDWIVPICGPAVEIRHGVDLEVFKPARKRGRRKKKLRVGIVGRINALKIPAEFLVELEKIDGALVEFHFYGDTLGISSNNLLAERIGKIKAVKMVRCVPRGGLPEVYNQFDIVLIPEMIGAVNRVALEAMACGVPVLALSVDGLPDTVGVGGKLFGNHAEMLEAIKWPSPQERKAARKHVAELYDIKRMFRQYARLYARKSGGAIRCEKVFAGMATIPGRERTLKIAVESIAPQVDVLHVVLNGYENVPDFLLNQPGGNVTYSRAARDAGAREKYMLAAHVDGYYFTCDDDNNYPPDYVDKMIALIEKKNRKVLVGVMGGHVYPPIRNWITDHRTINANGEAPEISVDLLGTGCTAFHTELLRGEDPVKFIREPNYCDLYWAKWCVDNNVEQWIIGRDAEWFKCNEDIASGLWAFNNNDEWKTVTAIAAKIWRKPKKPGVFYYGGFGIGNYILTTPLLAALDNPTIYIIEDEPWGREVESILPYKIKFIPRKDTANYIAQHDSLIFPMGVPPGMRSVRSVKTRHERWQNGSGKRHEVYSYMSIVSDEKPGPTRIKTARHFPWEWADKKKRIVFCNSSNPDKKWLGKKWPIGHWQVLGELLSGQNAAILFLGGKTDKAEGAEIILPNYKNMAGEFSFAESAEACRQADIVIATDTGLMFAADAVGVPVVALFGMTPFGKAAPWNDTSHVIQSRGGNCPRFSCYQKADQGKCGEFSCMAAITPERVFDEVTKVIGTKKPKIVVVEYGENSYHFSAPYPEDLLVFRWYNLGRFYELDLLEKLASFNPTGVIIDVGANLGNHSVFFLNETNCSAVMAIETIQLLAGALHKNLKMNNPRGKSYEVHQIAAGGQDGHIELGMIDPKNTGSTMMRGDGKPGVLCRLDGMGVDGKVSIIKIDVEGMEPDVIYGAMGLIERDHPIITTEAATNEELTRVAGLLEPLGYKNLGKFGHTPTYIWQVEKCV